MHKSHMIMSFCNSGKTLTLIRKSVEAALNGRMVLYVNVELRPDMLSQRFYAYREDDSILANNINYITIPVGDAGLEYFRDYIKANPHYDLIAFDMPQIITGTIDKLHEFIMELKTYADVIFTTQANRYALSVLENGDALPYMEKAFSTSDTAIFLIKANNPDDVCVEEHVISEFPIDVKTGEFDSNNVSSYYIEIAENGEPRLNQFHTHRNINIWGIKQCNLMSVIANTDNYLVRE